jgi:hypothetical protein
MENHIECAVVSEGCDRGFTDLVEPLNIYDNSEDQFKWPYTKYFFESVKCIV